VMVVAGPVLAVRERVLVDGLALAVGHGPGHTNPSAREEREQVDAREEGVNVQREADVVEVLGEEVRADEPDRARRNARES
jgi:hypothetical protein